MIAASPDVLNSNHRASLRGKVLATVIGTSLLAIIGASLALFAHQVFYQRGQFRTDMEALARIVADYAVAPISFNDEVGMQEALAVLQAKPEVLEAKLVTPAGLLFHQFGDTQISEHIHLQGPENPSTPAGHLSSATYAVSG